MQISALNLNYPGSTNSKNDSSVTFGAKKYSFYRKGALRFDDRFERIAKNNGAQKRAKFNTQRAIELYQNWLPQNSLNIASR